MPIKHSALKQLRKDRRRHDRNQAVQSELRTLTKRFLATLQDKQVDQAKTLLTELSKKLDRAASKGVIHRNTASRSVSRLSKRLNKLPAK